MHNTNTRVNEILSIASKALSEQIEALRLIHDGLGQTFVEAVDLLSSAKTIITTGLGKSSFIARKMAASLNSVRLRSVYMHPVDALHGDSGFLDPEDVLVAFSKSGETPELIRFIAQAKQLGLHIIAVTSRASTSIGSQADLVLTAPFTRELDSQNLIPTASTTSALVVADLLTVCIVEMSGNMIERLQRTHPNGAIGSALLRTIDEVMHSGASIPKVLDTQLVNAALIELTTKALGIVCVCDANGELRGIITDGDVRRLATKGIEIGHQVVTEIMTSSPLTITANATVHEALVLMENRDRQINVLPVVQHGKVVGVVRVHDLVRVAL